MTFKTAVREFLLDLIGAIAIVAGFAWAARDAWVDGQLAISTSIGLLILVAFGGWAIDRTILERFIAWIAGQAKTIGAIAKDVKGGDDAPR